MSGLTYIAHTNINTKKWDEAILNSELPTVFAQSYFLDATSPGWDALVINDYESVFPLTWKKKFGMSYLPQPYFTGQLGAFGKINLEQEKEFQNYISKKYRLIEIELNATNQFESKFNQAKNTFVIEYAKGFTFNQNTKRNISKAIATELRVEKVLSNELVSLSEQILNPFLLDDLNLPTQEVAKFKTLLENCITKNSIVTFKTVNEANEVKAIGHFVFNARYVVFLKGTNTDKQENSGSMHLLISHAIDYFKDKCETFDFGGGSLHEGLAGFYKGLGGTQRDYHLLKINNLPPLFKMFKK